MSDSEMYLSGLSITDISKITGKPLSTLRFRFKRLGILRTRSDGIRLAGKNGNLGSGNRGKNRVFSQEWKDNIAKSKLGKGVGTSIKPNGYVEITMGDNKGRSKHVVMMEEKIGRKLFRNECVHHINEIRNDNRIENLQLMTLCEHAKLHATKNHINRKRDKNGKFE